MNILVTGGTGSFGQAFIRHMLTTDAERIAVFSRDELKQYEMRAAGLTDVRLRYFVGDVRELERLRRAFRDVDVVVHAAALKQVDSCEFNPLEAKKTNIDGTQNVIDAALDCGVGKVLMIGTDKAVDPINLYGATKLVAEKLIVDANVYSGEGGTMFSATRYGNVITSRGSVLPRFLAQRQAGELLTVTDPEMTRFVLTIDQAVTFVRRCLGSMKGGEVFVPRLPAVTVGTIADAVTWPARESWELIQKRPGEKQHEVLVSVGELDRTIRWPEHFVIHPGRVVDGLREPYSSSAAARLSVAGFRELAGLGLTLEATA